MTSRFNKLDDILFELNMYFENINRIIEITFEHDKKSKWLKYYNEKLKMFVSSEEAKNLKDQYESAKVFRKTLNLQKDSTSNQQL